MVQDLKLGGDKDLVLDSSTTDLAEGATFTLKKENTGAWCMTLDADCINQSLMVKTDVPNGHLYNWYAATAGSGAYNTGANVTINYSICPRNWELPTGGTSGQFVALDEAYGGGSTNRSDAAQRDKFLAAPLNFDYTGYRYGGSVNYPSSHAYYWSRTAASITSAYGLSFNTNSNFNPQYNYYNNMFDGFTLRCLTAQ